MPTTDGITNRDWDKVHTLALLVVKASGSKPSNLKAAKARLLRYLEKLESKYGELPSILATRADFITNTAESLTLLKRAYALAKKSNDKANLTYIASSIAELYVEYRCDKKHGKIWLEKLRTCLINCFDKGEYGVYKALQKVVKKRVLPGAARKHQFKTST
jgi:hypothetical protein